MAYSHYKFYIKIKDYGFESHLPTWQNSFTYVASKTIGGQGLCLIPVNLELWETDMRASL